MKIYFVTTPADKKNKLLNRTDTKNRLLSYYYIKDREHNFLKRYNQIGLVNHKIKKTEVIK